VCIEPFFVRFFAQGAPPLSAKSLSSFYMRHCKVESFAKDVCIRHLSVLMRDMTWGCDIRRIEERRGATPRT